MTKPLIKWSGRKSYLTPYVDEYLIKLNRAQFTYYEPFMGSGAIFFHLANQNKIKTAHLNDILTELIFVYKTIESTGIQSFMENITKEVNRYSFHENGRKRNYQSKTILFKDWKDEFNSLISPDKINKLNRKNKIRLSILFFYLIIHVSTAYIEKSKRIVQCTSRKNSHKKGIKDNNISIPDISIFKDAKNYLKAQMRLLVQQILKMH